jgi:catalase
VSADRFNGNIDNDDFIQARNLFRLMRKDEQQRLCSNIAESMTGVPQEIQERQCALFLQVDPAYGAGVQDALTCINKKIPSQKSSSTQH